jgi:hypothetical protein
VRKFTLYDLPQEVWDRCKARSDREGWDLPALVAQLMDDYGSNRITPTGPPQKKRSLSRPTDGT